MRKRTEGGQMGGQSSRPQKVHHGRTAIQIWNYPGQYEMFPSFLGLRICPYGTACYRVVP